MSSVKGNAASFKENRFELEKLSEHPNEFDSVRGHRMRAGAPINAIIKLYISIIMHL